MLGMMNCQTENYEFYASPSSSTFQLRQGGTDQQQQSVEGLEMMFSRRKQKEQITYTNGRRLIDGKLGEASRRVPEKLWTRVIVDNLTARRLRRDGSDKEVEEEAEGSGAQPAERDGGAAKRRTERRRHNEAKKDEEEEEGAVEKSGQQKNSSLCSLLSKLKPRKKTCQQH